MRGFTGTASNGFGKKKKTARDMFLKKRKGEDDAKLTPEQRYQKLVQEKTEELRAKMQRENKYGGFSLPGTDPNASKKLSKSAEALLEMMAKKKVKEEQRKQAKVKAAKEHKIKAEKAAAAKKKAMQPASSIYGTQGHGSTNGGGIWGGNGGTIWG